MTIKKLAIGVGIALAVLIAAVWWLFFWGDTPEAVDVEAANTQLDIDLAVATDDAPAAAPDPFDGDIDATWVVDDEIDPDERAARSEVTHGPCTTWREHAIRCGEGGKCRTDARW